MNSIADAVEGIVRKEFDKTSGQSAPQFTSDAEWAKVARAGSELWLDTGDMDGAAAAWTTEFRALTTNNTLLNNEIQKGIYDELVKTVVVELRKEFPEITEKQLVVETAFALNAIHGLRLVDRFGANVSVELHTDFANDLEGSVEYGLRYHRIHPDKFIVKLPLTSSGLLAVRKLSDRGVLVNFTLGFSARQNYLAALLSRPAYVNVFMGRLNAFVADSQLGSGANVGEKATLSTQRTLLELREDGVVATRLIGASIRSGDQIAAVVGTDVLTMPPKAATQYRQSCPRETSSCVGEDPEIPLAPGVTIDSFGGRALWEVPDALRKCVESLVGGHVAQLSPGDVELHLRDGGFGDLLPEWSAQDLETITRDGKIPVFETWKDRLTSGEIGLDALMNISALRSFTTDQKALDDRILSLLR